MATDKDRGDALTKAYLELGERLVDQHQGVIEQIREAAIRGDHETFASGISELVMNAVDATLFSEHPHILASLAMRPTVH
jgi:hypothetical protein